LFLRAENPEQAGDPWLFRYLSGFTGLPLWMTSMWTGGPVERPADPINAVVQ
jgi:hypothetical protein